MAESRKSAIRVCFLAEIFYPEVKDGLSRHAHQLAGSLISKGVELFVITRKMKRESKPFELVGNVPVQRISPVGRFKGKGWNAVVPLIRLLIVAPCLLVRYIRRYDIVMVSGVKILSLPAVLMSMAFRKISIVKIESPSELYEDVSVESLRRMRLSTTSPILKALRMMRNRVIRRADHFIAITPEIRRQLMDIGVDERKIVCIENGIDIERFSPAQAGTRNGLRRKLSLPEDAAIVAYAGRLVVSKGILRLAEAWESLLSSRKDIHLLLVGTGQGSFDDCEVELKEYVAAHGFEKHVSFTGSVDNVDEYLMASNIFVLPSDYEGFSLALLEGLACALPTVATRVGGAIDLIQNGRNGLLIEPKDTQELKAALEWVLERRQQWEEMGRRARESARKYGIDDVADKYIALFARLMERKRPAWELQRSEHSETT